MGLSSGLVWEPPPAWHSVGGSTLAATGPAEIQEEKIMLRYAVNYE